MCACVFFFFFKRVDRISDILSLVAASSGLMTNLVDNRHVLIDVSAPLTQTTGGLYQGMKDMRSFLSA